MRRSARNELRAALDELQHVTTWQVTRTTVAIQLNLLSGVELHQLRAEMHELDWMPEPIPEFSSKIPAALLPDCVWMRSRNNGKQTVGADKFYLCHLCSQAAVARDPKMAVCFFCTT